MVFETAKNRQIFLLKLNRQESLLRAFLPRLPMSLPLLDSASFSVSATNGSYCIVNDLSLIHISKAGLDKSVHQYFAVLTNMRSVGVMGDFRTYDYTLALRGVTTSDFMTADWARIPYEVLDKVSVRIVNEVDHINRI